MAKVLKRLLRLRSLLEDAARTDLELQAMRSARVDQAVRREAEAALQLRARSFARLLASGGTAAGPSRMETEAEREGRFLAGKEGEAGLTIRGRLQRLAAQEAGCMLVRRDAFLMRRKERQQVEILLEAESRQRRLDEVRREQREIDDWYATSRAQRRRREDGR